MKRCLLCAALLTLLLPGCKAPESAAGTAPAAAAAATTPAPATAPAAAPKPAPSDARPALPSGACDRTQDGFAAFLEAIVSDPAVRAAYSAPTVAEGDLRDPSKHVARPGEPFRLALIDYSWSYDEPGKDPGQLARVKLDITPDGERMRVDFVKAEFSADDEVVKTLGAPEAYVFDYTQQCWRLAQHLR
ncbi:hypothetical protein [Xanthomonas medicagonis]|uniref:hypothetical protein n=1 Tax=Xanthomonas medicagonis TaxID=3160841 RepID=UPI0035188AF2